MPQLRSSKQTHIAFFSIVRETDVFARSVFAQSGEKFNATKAFRCKDFFHASISADHSLNPANLHFHPLRVTQVHLLQMAQAKSQENPDDSNAKRKKATAWIVFYR